MLRMQLADYMPLQCKTSEPNVICNHWNYQENHDNLVWVDATKYNIEKVPEKELVYYIKSKGNKLYENSAMPLTIVH